MSGSSIGVPLILNPKAASPTRELLEGLKELAGGKAGSTELPIARNESMFEGASKTHTGKPPSKSALLLITKKNVPASREKEVGIVRKAWSEIGLLTVRRNSARTALVGVPGPMESVTWTITSNVGPVVFIKRAISVMVAFSGKVNLCAKNWLLRMANPPLGFSGAPESIRIFASAGAVRAPVRRNTDTRATPSKFATLIVGLLGPPPGLPLP
jgi:hypothetical protein